MHFRIPLLLRLLCRGRFAALRIGESTIDLILPDQEVIEVHGHEFRDCWEKRGWVWSCINLEVSIDGEDREFEVRGLAPWSASRIRESLRAWVVADDAEAAVDAFDRLLASDRYVRRAQVVAWEEQFEDVYLECRDLELDPDLPEMIAQIISSLAECYPRSREETEVRNEGFVAAETDFLVATDWGQRLTEEQKDAVLHDEDNVLVLAAAGSGKTTTILGKAAYLVARGVVSHGSRVLLLAFTRSAKDELLSRLDSLEIEGICVRTFHGVGLEIIARATGRKPSVSRLATDQRAFRSFLAAESTDLLRSPSEGTPLRQYLAKYPNEMVRPDDYETPSEYFRAMKQQDLRSLRGEPVKSHGELVIANWLTLNGIAYVYEGPYEHDLASVQYRQYEPDFRLVESGIYVEYFGTDVHGVVRPDIGQQRYLDSITWKRDIHRKHGTVLIELTYGDLQQQVLELSLERALAEHDVIPTPPSSEELTEIVRNSSVFSRFINLSATFIRLLKSAGLSDQALRQRCQQLADPNRGLAFLACQKLLLERYQAHLADSGSVDFEDMILQATAYLRAGDYQVDYEYVLVDEYQDISYARNQLLKELRRSVGNCRLLCVGDDWQSIYRFAGSDLGPIVNFQEEFGDARVSRLQETFRFAGELLELSSRFVQANPNQLPKSVHSSRAAEAPAVFVRRSWAERTAPRQALEEIANVLANRSGEARPTVLIIGRYRHNRPDDLSDLQRAFPALEIEFSTAHSAKGMEADHVVLVEVNAGTFGFPSEIADDPILNLVLSQSEGYPHAEERRLFYVAITRARYSVHVLSGEVSASTFVNEICSEPYSEYVEAMGAAVVLGSCPSCGGSFVLRDGPYGEYWSCLNEPYCSERARGCQECDRGAMIRNGEWFECSNPECKAADPVCPECGSGALLSRSGPYGEFLGCTNYRPEGPSCPGKRRL
jgi:DNA helicase-4